MNNPDAPRDPADGDAEELARVELRALGVDTSAFPRGGAFARGYLAAMRDTRNGKLN